MKPVHHLARFGSLLDMTQVLADDVSANSETYIVTSSISWSTDSASILAVGWVCVHVWVYVSVLLFTKEKLQDMYTWRAAESDINFYLFTRISRVHTTLILFMRVILPIATYFLMNEDNALNIAYIHHAFLILYFNFSEAVILCMMPIFFCITGCVVVVKDIKITAGTCKIKSYH